MARIESDQRVDWVDFSKGICIVAVVSFYATFYIEGMVGTEGWMQYWVDFARPFRMPDFFMIAGLFLARTIDRPWRIYLDKKIVHFAYFFALWTTIYFIAAVLKGEFSAEQVLWKEYVWWYIEPFHMLWFIAMLPVYFLATRFAKPVPWIIVLFLAAALQIWHPESGWRQLDRFGERYVYFYIGYLFAPLIFQFAAWIKANPRRALAILGCWASLNELIVYLGFSEKPGFSLVLGVVGALAVIATSSLLSKITWMDWLRYLGEHSIVIFLAFFAFLVASARALGAVNIKWDVGLLTLVVSIAAVSGSVVLYWIVLRTPLRILFERPPWATIRSAKTSDKVSKLPQSELPVQ
jgi:uncharacterized membrane protein YcfT